MKQPKINDNPLIPDAISPKPSETQDDVREDGLSPEGFIGNPVKGLGVGFNPESMGVPGEDVPYQPTNYLLYD